MNTRRYVALLWWEQAVHALESDDPVALLALAGEYLVAGREGFAWGVPSERFDQVLENALYELEREAIDPEDAFGLLSQELRESACVAGVVRVVGFDVEGGVENPSVEV